MLGLAALLAGLVWFFGSIIWVVQLSVISLLLVYFLLPGVEYLERRHNISHSLSVTAIFFMFLGLIVALFAIIVPLTQRELERIARSAPGYLEQFQYFLFEAGRYLELIGVNPNYLVDFLGFPTELQPLLESIMRLAIIFGESIIDIFFILFIVFYLLYDFHNVRSYFMGLVPPPQRGKAEDVMQIIDTNLGGYIRGTIIRCILVGVFVGVSLYIIGMPYALLLGVLAGVFDVALYIGPYLAALPALLIAFSPQTPSFIVVALIYIVVQAVESMVLSPVLLSKTVKLRPITVIISLLVGLQVAGFLGLIIAVPLAGIAKNLVEYIGYKQGGEDDGVGNGEGATREITGKIVE